MISFGSRVYGLGAIALGLAGLVWGDFALVWQPVPPGVPGRTALAYATGQRLRARRSTGGGRPRSAPRL
jgi:hypothetical protein